MLALCGDLVFISLASVKLNNISTKWAKHKVIGSVSTTSQYHSCSKLLTSVIHPAAVACLCPWPPPPTWCWGEVRNIVSLCGLVRLPSCEKDSEAVNNTVHFFLSEAYSTKLSLLPSEGESQTEQQNKGFSIILSIWSHCPCLPPAFKWQSHVIEM